MRKVGKRVVWGILVFFLLFVGSGFGGEEIARPTADMKVENLVPLDFAQKIAIYRAKQEWGTVAIGQPIIGCDKDGKVVVYIFPFKLNAQIFPADSVIIQHIKEARRTYVTLQKNKRARKEAEKIKRIRNKMWGIGEFGTVAVSARKDLHPIFEVSNVLPRYYTMGYLAKEKVEEQLSTSGVKLKRLFYLSPLDQFYEFSNGEKRILVNAFNLRMLTPEDFRNMIEMSKNKAKKLKKSISEEEMRKINKKESTIKRYIKNKWEKYEEVVK